MNTNELDQTPVEAVTPTIETTEAAAEALPLETTETATGVVTASHEAVEDPPLDSTARAAEVVTSSQEATEAAAETVPLDATATAAEVVTRGETTDTATEAVTRKETTEPAAAAAAVPDDKATDAPGLCKPDLFGRPPLIPGEDSATYEALRVEIWRALQPKDALEEINVQDMVDLTWEARRMHRLKVNLLRVAAPEAVEKILRTLKPSSSSSYSSSSYKDIGRRWTLCEPQALKEITGLLAPAGLGPEAVTALALAANLDPFERMNRIGAGAEGRRNLIPREIDRHRAAVATAAKERAQRGAYSSLFKK
jgi:hypothetical protein